MLDKIKEFFKRVIDYCEEAQMARAREAMKNSQWSRIE